MAEPKSRDNKDRPAFIPPAAVKKRQEKAENAMEEDDEDTEAPRRKTEREIELEQGDDYIVDLKKNYDLPDDQKYDVIPETWQGHNIADFIDPDIMEKLAELEAEEEAREKAGYYDSEESEEEEGMEEIHSLAQKIRYKKAQMKQEQWIDNTTKPVLPRNTVAKKRERSVSRLRAEFTELGVDMAGTGEHFTRSTGRSASRPAKRAKMDTSQSRAASRTPRDQSGLRDPEQKKKLKKMEKKMQRKKFNQSGKAGESDRHIAVKKPKHLFTGKRGVGKTDRR